MNANPYFDYLFNTRPDQGSKIILETLGEIGIEVKDGKEVCKGLEKILQGSVTRMDFRLEDSKIEIESDEDMELNILLDGVRIATFDTSVQRN